MSSYEKEDQSLIRQTLGTSDDWQTLAFSAFESYLQYGRGALSLTQGYAPIYIPLDRLVNSDDDLLTSNLSALLEKHIRAYDPEREMVLVFRSGRNGAMVVERATTDKQDHFPVAVYAALTGSQDD